MKRFTAALAGLALLATATTALAMDATGTIKAMDPDAMTITLDDDTVYTVPEDFDMTTVAVGDTVMITYESQDGTNMASEVVPE